MKNDMTLKKKNEEDFKRIKKPKNSDKFDPARKNKKHYLQKPHEYI
jgi:hypothetical protein